MVPIPVWHLSVVGAPRLHAVDREARPLPLSRKDAALLVYVALNGTIPSALAAGLLWPHVDERRALNSLRQRVHRLRRETGARLLEVADTARLADDLRFDAQPDIAALERDPTAWDEELLGAHAYDDADEFGAWLAQVRKARADARSEALARIASEAEQQGQLARALVYAQRLLAHEPLSEHVHRRLMRLHYTRGDTASAVAAFERCERTLKDELGLKPSGETQELLRTIERGALPAPVSALPLPASLLRPPRAVGRDSERARLAQAHAAGHIAVLVGEAGMGKTRLLQDFLAGQPAAVYVQARPGDLGVPYGVLGRLLRAVIAAAPAAIDRAPRAELARVAPEVGDAVGTIGVGQSARLQAAVEQLLAAALELGLSTLIADDLHFADRASIEMLRALIDAEALAGLRWVFAHRPIDAADEDGALLQSLAESSRARWVVLAPLTGADLAELLESLALPGVDAAALAPALARHTGGNPLYALETLRSMQTQRGAPGGGGAAPGVLPRPEGIEHMLDRRLQRLSKPALALARVAAIAVPDFSIELAEHALATPALVLADAWRELEAADVLRGEGFAHDLVHDAMRRATPEAIAVHAHKLIAQFLQRNGVEPARVARHWLAAGEGRAAAEASLLAAQRALAAGRKREQAAWLGHAASAFDKAGDADATHRTGADAICALLESDGPDAALALAERLLAAGPDGPRVAHIWAARATAQLWGGHVAESEASARRALALAPEEDLEVRLAATRTLAIAAGQRGDAPAGLGLLRAWATRIEQVADAEQRLQFHADYTHVLLQSDLQAEALPAGEKHLALARETDNPIEQAHALMNLSAARQRRGDLELALGHAAEADRLMADRAQSDSIAAWNRSQLGALMGAAGRFDEGLALVEQARTAMASQRTNTALVSVSETYTARLLLQLGQAAGAYRMVRDDREGLPPRLRAGRLAARAAVRQAMQGNGEALLREALALCGEGASAFERLQIGLALTPYEESAEARIARCAAVQQEAAEREFFSIAAAAGAERLKLLTAIGALDELQRLAPQVEQAARAHRGLVAYFPALLEVCSAAHVKLGREDDARRCVADALHWVHTVALPHVPPAYRDSFLNRNPVNVRLLAQASRAAADRR